MSRWSRICENPNCFNEVSKTRHCSRECRKLMYEKKDKESVCLPIIEDNNCSFTFVDKLNELIISNFQGTTDNKLFNKKVQSWENLKINKINSCHKSKSCSDLLSIVIF